MLYQSSNMKIEPSRRMLEHMLKSSHLEIAVAWRDVIGRRKHSSAASDLGRMQHSEKSFSPELEGLDLTAFTYESLMLDHCPEQSRNGETVSKLHCAVKR